MRRYRSPARSAPTFSRVQYIRSMTWSWTSTRSHVEGQAIRGHLTLYAMTFPVASQPSANSEPPKGTGPYWFVSSDWNGNVRLERNLDPGGKSRPRCRPLPGSGMHSDTDALTALETHEVDCVATRSTTGALLRQLSDRATIDYSTLTWERPAPDLSHSMHGRSGGARGADVRHRPILAGQQRLPGPGAGERGADRSRGSFLYEPQSTQFNYSPERALADTPHRRGLAGYQRRRHTRPHQRTACGRIWASRSPPMTSRAPSSAPRRSQAIAQQLGRIGLKVTYRTVSKYAA